MAFKEQLEILTALLDPKEGATECFDEAIEETISAMMSDATQIPEEGNFEDSLPVIQNFISLLKSQHPLVDKYLHLLLKLRPESIFALAFAQIWYEKFPQITVAQPPQKKRKKNAKKTLKKTLKN
ncbi:MAG: hypothetical protein WC748_03280 [Legionellales bacterium]|jgi:hypothetical protein